MSIADGALGCAHAFQAVAAPILERETQDYQKTADNVTFTTKVNDSFERFQLWSSNLGARRRDKSSLDQRLVEASHLRNRVLEYLKDLQQGLIDASTIVTGARIPWDELSDSSSDEDDDNIKDSTELDQLATYISNIINCLLRISMVIQKPAPHDRFISSGRFDQSYRQPWDEQHVRDKFPSIPDWLTERLGKAITRRRQFLKYRKNHHDIIANHEASGGPEDTGTVVSSLPTVAKDNQGLEALIRHDFIKLEIQSDAGASETSYAETVASGNTLFVPRLPDATQDGALFECPYCFMIRRHS